MGGAAAAVFSGSAVQLTSARPGSTSQCSTLRLNHGELSHLQVLVMRCLAEADVLVLWVRTSHSLEPLAQRKLLHRCSQQQQVLHTKWFHRQGTWHSSSTSLDWGVSPEANRRNAGVGRYVKVVPLSKTVPYPWSNRA